MALRIALVVAALAVGSAAVRAERPRGDDSAGVHVVLRLDERRVYVVPRERGEDTRHAVVSFPVAVGRPEYATPTGRFAVKEKLVDPDFVRFDWDAPERELGRMPPGPDNPLGLRWIGFASAHGWQIGFHGTPRPELLGQAVSHGCVRMRNRDVVDLYRRVDVGTPVIVRP